MRDTFRPVRPRLTYFTVVLLSNKRVKF